MQLAQGYQQYQKNQMDLENLKTYQDWSKQNAQNAADPTKQGAPGTQGVGAPGAITQPPARQGDTQDPGDATQPGPTTPGYNPPPDTKEQTAYKKGFADREREAYATPSTPNKPAAATTPQLPGPNVPSPAQQSQDTGLPLAYTPITPTVPAAPTPPAVGRVPVVPQAPQAPEPDTSMSAQGRTPALTAVPSAASRFLPTAQPPYNAAGVAGAPGTPSGPAVAAPAPARAPLQAWPAPTPQLAPPPATTTPAPQPAVPAGTPAPIPMAPVAQAQPQRGGLLAALNPIGSAQAAEVPPAPTAPQPAIPPAQTSRPAGTQAATAPIPTVTVTAPRPGGVPTAALAPPQPPTMATREAAPTRPVAPAQKGPTEEYQPPAVPAASLHVDPRPWEYIQAHQPKEAAEIRYAVDKYGDGQTTYAEMAAHYFRENGYKYPIPSSSPDGDGGVSHGVMQVQDGTWQTAGMGRAANGEFDPHTSQGSFNQAAIVLSYLGQHANGGLGASTVQQNYAYMRGQGAALNATRNGWAAEAKANPQGAGFLNRFYDGQPVASGMFPGPFGKGENHATVAAQIVTAGAQGPDSALKTIASWTPAGMGLTQGWQNAQRALEMHAIMSGNYAALPVIQNYFAGVMHQGALSHLQAGYEAFQQGNIELAAQHLVKGYAFVPDGADMRAATDTKGQLWLQTYSEKTGLPQGQAFRVTGNMIMEQMAALGTSPQNFQAAVLKSRYQNAQIDELEGRAAYYRDRPDAQREVAQIRAAAQEQVAAERAATAEAKAGAKTASDTTLREIDKDIATKYDPQTTGASPEDSVRQSRLATALRYPQNVGGAGLPAAESNYHVGEVAAGREVPGQYTRPDGKTVNGLWKKGDDPTKTAPIVSFEYGGRFLKGAPTVNPAADSSKGALNLPNRPAIGAGLGTQMAAMSGYGQNLSGIPMQSQPPPEQQQAAA
jgi:hypothetical protein